MFKTFLLYIYIYIFFGKSYWDFQGLYTLLSFFMQHLKSESVILFPHQEFTASVSSAPANTVCGVSPGLTCSFCSLKTNIQSLVIYLF